MWWSRPPKGVLGAPRALASPRLSLPVLAAIAGLGVFLPLFGISLVVVVLLERLVFVASHGRVRFSDYALTVRPAVDAASLSVALNAR
jgi:uncharacterized iron-regulated membrane protein